MPKLPAKLKFLIKFLLLSPPLYWFWRYLGQSYYLVLQKAGNLCFRLSFSSGKLLSAKEVVAGGQEIIYLYKDGNIYSPLNLEVLSLNLLLYLCLVLASDLFPEDIPWLIVKLAASLLMMAGFHVLIIELNYLNALQGVTFLPLLLSLTNFMNGLILPLLLWFWTIGAKANIIQS